MIYEYLCKIHGVFEVQQSMKELPLENCSKCLQEENIEYHCKDCDSSWISNIDEKNKLCECASTNLEKRSPKPKKLISLSSFTLKGGGWASTGYNK